MYSTLIGKMEKAKRYAEEPGRVSICQFEASFRGEHGSYTVGFRDGQWQCSCRFFPGHGTCSHTMALQRLLEPMLPAQSPAPA